jgi:hypothetical protein
MLPEVLVVGRLPHAGFVKELSLEIFLHKTVVGGHRVLERD